MAEEDKLKQYMELLETLSGGIPSENALRKLQSQCELEPSDLKKLEMLVERHNDRADIYLHRDNVNGAIEEMERACQLTPRDPFLHLNLAKLYKNRYENYGFLRRDRVRAREEAETTGELDPSLSEPAELIAEVELIHKSLNSGAGKTRPIIPVILLSILLIILMLFSWRKTLIDWISNVINPPQEVVYTPPAETFDPTISRDVGLESYGFTDNNLNLSLHSSRIFPINDHWGYELQGGLTSPALAIDKTDLELRFLDEKRSLVYSESLTLDEKALVLPGETLPVDLFFFLPFPPGAVDSVSVTPGNMILVPVEEPDTSKVKLWWEGEKPEGVRLALEERETDTTEGYDRNIHYFTFDISQGGQKDIGHLELTFRWKDNRENTIVSRKLTPVRIDGPPMEGGESRAFSFYVSSPFAVDWESLVYDATVTAVELAF